MPAIIIFAYLWILWLTLPGLLSFPYTSFVDPWRECFDPKWPSDEIKEMADRGRSLFACSDSSSTSCFWRKFCMRALYFALVFMMSLCGPFAAMRPDFMKSTLSHWLRNYNGEVNDMKQRVCTGQCCVRVQVVKSGATSPPAGVRSHHTLTQIQDYCGGVVLRGRVLGGEVRRSCQVGSHPRGELSSGGVVLDTEAEMYRSPSPGCQIRVRVITSKSESESSPQSPSPSPRVRVKKKKSSPSHESSSPHIQHLFVFQNMKINNKMYRMSE